MLTVYIAWAVLRLLAGANIQHLNTLVKYFDNDFFLNRLETRGGSNKSNKSNKVTGLPRVLLLLPLLLRRHCESRNMPPLSS